jgi:hypothetical protein
MASSSLAKALLGAALLAPPQGAPEDRLYGSVETVHGEVHTGFIRWGRAGVGWSDLLGGYKELSEENLRQVVRLRAEADPEADRAARSIVYNGVRITWDEDDRDFAPDTAQSGVRFGHVQSVEPAGQGAARIRLKSGISFELAAADRRDGFVDSLHVEVGGSELPLPWEDVVRVELRSAPPGPAPRLERLHGTVRVREGPTFTGYLSFDAGRLYTDDVWVGREGDRERTVPLAGVRALAWDPRTSRVVLTLAGGETVSLTDPRSGNRSVRLQDPALGGVQLPLNRVEALTFHAPSPRGGYDAYDGAHRLRGTVTTRKGERYTGYLRWDNDESFSWEVLNGSENGVTYTLELGAVRSIQVETPVRALVTLGDGRQLELSGSNDVGEGNKGVVIELDDGTFRFVDWVQIAHAELAGP